jgi:hypothetical protein
LNVYATVVQISGPKDPDYISDMSVRTLQRTDGAIFFCTFTCYGWMHLIELTKCYDRIYNWMRIAHDNGFCKLPLFSGRS